MVGSDEKEDQVKIMKVSGASLSDLLGRQSVRATFRLSEKAVEAISIVAGHLGIKQKSLFDHLIEDRSSLQEIARNIASFRVIETTRVQKTFVLSRRTLDSLESISKRFGTPRDALVEYSIKRLEAIIDDEREKHYQREAIAREFRAHVSALQALKDNAAAILGHQDNASKILQKHSMSAVNCLKEMEAVLEKGRLIEKF